MSKARDAVCGFFLREWLAVISGVALLLTSAYVGRLPPFSSDELEVLFLLFALFVVIEGLVRSGFIPALALRVERGGLVPLKLVALTFLLSAVITNDLALLVMVPLTLALDVDKKGVLVIMEALAANAGSALTPFGNPQNLYIYWHYDLRPFEFIRTMVPFSLGLLAFLAAASLFLKTRRAGREADDRKIAPQAYIYVALFGVILLAVFRILPVLGGLPAIAYAFLFDRRSLKIDYTLLLSFFFLFGVAENIALILEPEISRFGHVFLFSALASQVMSNVPATLLLAKFTADWKALLWGVNAGGFGSLFGSFANLIAYRIYVKDKDTSRKAGFTVLFVFLGYLAFFLSVGLFFLLYGP